MAVGDGVWLDGFMEACETAHGRIYLLRLALLSLPIADSTLTTSSPRNIPTSSTSTGSIAYILCYRTRSHSSRVTERNKLYQLRSFDIYGKWRITFARASSSPKQHASHASLVRSHWPSPKLRAATTA